jgi:phenylacetate-CoA ligase
MSPTRPSLTTIEICPIYGCVNRLNVGRHGFVSSAIAGILRAQPAFLMSRSDARATYERIRAAHLGAVRAALEDHVGRLEWSRERIERYRDQRLRAVFTYARERSPFHARQLQSVDPSSASVPDLASLPMMTKQDAQEHWDAIVTASDLTRAGAERVLAEQHWFSYTPGDRQVFSSGGSSGVRGVYVWDWQFFVSVACLAWRVQAREEWRGPPAPARLAVLEAGVPPHASTPLFDVPTTAAMETFVIPAGAPFDEVLAAVSAAPPTHLVGYASVVGRLARATLAGELPLRPVRVSTNSEPLLDEDRQAIREAWNVPVHNLWGSTEIGVQAVGCGVGEGLHVCEDEVVLERVDDDGVPVSADEPAARTLATGLANRTFPFIRYDLGDQVEWLSGPCACGSAFARVAEIGGRRDDDFRYRTTTVPASAFRHVLGTDPRVSEYQVTQTVAGAEILAVGTPDVDTLTSSMIAALRRHGLSDPEIRIRVVDRIPRHNASGKLRRFIALPRPVG